MAVVYVTAGIGIVGSETLSKLKFLSLWHLRLHRHHSARLFEYSRCSRKELLSATFSRYGV